MVEFAAYALLLDKPAAFSLWHKKALKCALLDFRANPKQIYNNDSY